MLHLDARVHFHEIELAGGIQQEFHGAGAFVANGFGCGDSRFAHAAAGFRLQPRAWGFLQQFLVAALDGAIPLTQVHHVAKTVGKDLHLDVARPRDEFLHVEARVTEGRFGLTLGRFKQALQLIGTAHQTHAAAAATSGGFDHHGIAHRARQASCFIDAGKQALAARDGGHTNPLHGGLGGGLIAHGPDRLRRRAHKDQPMGAADFSKAVVLGEEPIAGMNRIGTARGGRRNDVGDIQIAAAARGIPHADSLISQLHMQGIAIHRAVHSHRGDAHLPATTDDPQSDLTPVGDQKLANAQWGSASASDFISVRRGAFTKFQTDWYARFLPLGRPRGCGGIGRHARLRGV